MVSLMNEKQYTLLKNRHKYIAKVISKLKLVLNLHETHQINVDLYLYVVHTKYKLAFFSCEEAEMGVCHLPTEGQSLLRALLYILFFTFPL